MKLAYSTNAFTRTDIESEMRTIADIGFAGAEILCDRPHWFPGEVDDKQAGAMAGVLDECGLNRSVFVSECDRSKQLERIDTAERPIPLRVVEERERVVEIGEILPRDEPHLGVVV